MREILFRGFTPDEQGRDKAFVNGEWIKGQWVEGSYMTLRKTTYCFKEDYEANPDNTEHYIVFDQMTDWGLPNRHLKADIIPETLGQFIGLADKNGKKIFEGDILKSHYDDLYPDDYCHELVVWKDNGWCVQEGHGYDGLGDDEARKYSTVVGNVFDNPDLLEIVKNE